MSFVPLAATRFQQVPKPAGYLAGTTKEAGSPDSPVRRRVQVSAATSNAHGHLLPNTSTDVTWVWADESGNWRVDNLDPAKKYHVIAYDHTGQYDPVIKLNLVPSVD